jgi:capsular exopolysaccharide synthesis family protein
MAQYEMNLRDYWLIVRRRRLIVVVSTVLVALLSLWFARQRVPVFEAIASVKFEQSTALSGLLVEVLSFSTADSVETQATLIRSTPVLEEVARRLGRLPRMAPGENLRESRAYMAAIDSVAGRIKASRLPSTSIIEITASSSNAIEARDLANTVAESYRDYNRATRNTRIREARKFIESQLRDVEARVRQSEEQMWAFRQANGIITPGGESAILLTLFTQLRGEAEKTRQQRTELELASARLARVDAVSGGERVFVDSPNPALLKLQATQVELLLERNQLALEVTERHPRLQALDERAREVNAELRREVAAQITLLRQREQILDRQMAELLGRNREVPAVELGLQRLQRDAKVNDDLLTLLKTRHQEALIKESEGVEEVTLVRPATEPRAPVATDTLNTVLLGGLLGLMLGLVLAFVRETLDTSIGTIEDVESYLGIPVLGVVPHIDARDTMESLVGRRPALADVDPETLRSHALLITHFDPKSPVAEAYRTLRTNVQFMRAERGGTVLLLTSPTLQEGKTTTIVNLALTMAQNGQRTLLVGANLRRPSIHKFFGIEREPGLTDVLLGNGRWRDCVKTVTDILMGRFEMEDVMSAPGLDHLHILESGAVPANPSELLSQPSMAQFLREVREEYDVVLIDAPPVLPVADSAIIAAQVDGVVLVYQAGKVGRLVLKRAKALLESARAKVWGVVLNDVQTDIAGYAYAHYSTHYYGEETATEEPQGMLARTWARIKGRFGRGGGPGSAASGVETPPARDGRARRILGALLPVVAIGVAGGTVAWKAGWLEGGVQPRALALEPLKHPVPAALEGREDASGPHPAASTEDATHDAAAVAVAAAASPRPATRAPAAVPPEESARYAVEVGPFASTTDAERMERSLNEAGRQTVRFRQEAGTAVYAALLEGLADERQAQALVAQLRDEGFADVTLVGGRPPLAVRVGDVQLLRGAVQIAERLRALGHHVRLASQPGDAVSYVIRHGSFTSRGEAEEQVAELARQGLSVHVVRVR